jgi:hypothetical protein
MKSNEFTYWLKGFFELTHATSFTEKQYKMIEKELNQVFEEDKTPNSFCIEFRSASQFVENTLPNEQFVANLKARLEKSLAKKVSVKKVEEPKNDKPRLEALC